MNISYKINKINNPNINGFSFCAYYNQKIVGYIIISKEGDGAFILHKIFVQQEFQNKQIGSKLMNLLISFLKDIKKCCLLINYGKDINIKQFENFLSKFNWSPAKKMCTFYRVDMSLLKETYFDKFFEDKTSDEISIRFYNQIDDITIKRITDYVDVNVQNFSNPIKCCEQINKDLSIFAFDKHKQVIGWIIMEEFLKDELNITLSYVLKEYRNCGLGLKLQFYAYQHFSRLNMQNKYKYITFESFEEDKRVEKLYDLILRKSIINKFPIYRRVMNF